jgi:Protein of unknown function (DUF4038)/Putative collagen-binding domain of a collagenase/Putative Ig domain
LPKDLLEYGAGGELILTVPLKGPDVNLTRLPHLDGCLQAVTVLALLTTGCGGGNQRGTKAQNNTPSIVSSDVATFTVGVVGSFTITATGSPMPSLHLSNSLPMGVDFKDNGDGTGTLNGVPNTGTQGNYRLIITAHNAAGPDSVQIFTLNVNPATDGIVYPLKRDSNNRYLVDQNNVPVLILGDSPHSLLVRLGLADMANYMADRQAHGFNAILVQVLCNEATGGRSNAATFDGVTPFTSGSSPANYDLSTPNPAYFARLDSLISTAAADGLVVFLDPIDTAGWLRTLEANGATKAFNYGTFLGNRYKNSPNIVWQSGNDFQNWSANRTDNALIFQVMKGIASADANHLQTIELDYNKSHSSQDVLLGPVLTLNASYTYFETYDEDLAAYNSSPTLPMFLTEGNYEYENNNHSLPGLAGAFILREQEYWTMTSGGAGQLYGNHYTWTFPSNWRSFLDSPGVLEMPHWVKLFNAVSWWTLVPDQLHQILTAGYGTYNGSNLNLATATYATAAWNPNGSIAVVYDVSGSVLTVDLGKFNRGVHAEWYDPSNGVSTAVSGSPFANSGSMQFAPPGKNHDGDNDWVLVLAVKPINPGSPSALSNAQQRAAPHRSNAGNHPRVR